ACDKYTILIRYSTSKIYICEHSYHNKYYNSVYKYCLEYYKKEIYKQVTSFKKGLEKVEVDKDIFDNENINEDNYNNLDKEDNNEIEEDIDYKLQIAINNINQ
ncbi:3065_t:CDS:1, partial [Dentiscutata heterogama]